MGHSGIRFLLIYFFLVIMTRKKAAKKKKKWPREISPQGSRAAIFCVTHDGLSERGTTRGLRIEYDRDKSVRRFLNAAMTWYSGNLSLVTRMWHWPVGKEFWIPKFHSEVITISWVYGQSTSWIRHSLLPYWLTRWNSCLRKCWLQFELYHVIAPWSF